MTLSLTAVVNTACSQPESELQPGLTQKTGTEQTGSLEDDVAEYLRRFPYQVAYDLTVSIAAIACRAADRNR